MNRKHPRAAAVGLILLSLLTVSLLGLSSAQSPAKDRAATITGHVRLTAPSPGNSVIRMGVDPRCRDAAGGQQVLQERVLKDSDGGLRNTFVYLKGTFPKTPVPEAPVTIDQRGCIYVPRVVGVRVGQPLQVRNSDPVAHNVHSFSRVRANEFNVNQPRTGLVHTYKFSGEDILHLGCDVHSWMNAYVAVFDHPYFGVSGQSGAFLIRGVPPGTYVIESWHERYGILKKNVTVSAGETRTLDFAYTGKESAPND